MPPIISLPLQLGSAGCSDADEAVRFVERKLVRHAAPTLAGIKPANMFVLRSMQADAPEQTTQALAHVAAKLLPYGIRLETLAPRVNGVLLLAFRSREVAECMRDEQAASLLQAAKLPTHDVEALVAALKDRIAAADAARGERTAAAPERFTPCCGHGGAHHHHEPGHVCQCRAKAALAREEADATCGEAAFPHEIGIVLGYPAGDVRGFMEHAGANFVACGGWKAYAQPQAALRAFERNRRCTAECLQLFDSGVAIESLLAMEAGTATVSITALAAGM